MCKTYGPMGLLPGNVSYSIPCVMARALRMLELDATLNWRNVLGFTHGLLRDIAENFII